MKSKRFLIFFFVVIFSTISSLAQSSGDNLYNQGLKLQKTMTCKAQNQAIAKFQKAKKAYDSATKKAQCDNAISFSEQILNNLSCNKPKPNPSPTPNSKSKHGTTPERPVQPTLSLTNSEFNLDLDYKTLSVGVNTNQKEWSVTTFAGEDGSSFLDVRAEGNDKIVINVAANPTYSERSQKVVVKAGDLVREIVINQTGRRVNLDVNEKLLTFKEKGGKKKLTISCNSDMPYSQNSDANWYVESQPKWVKIVINDKQDKNNSGKKILGIKIGKQDNDGMIKTSVTLNCDPLMPGTIEAHNGRKGEVVIRSGDKSISIFVDQIGKVFNN